VFGQAFSKYNRDTRNNTGSYLGTARIGIDAPGSYVFKFVLTDSVTGDPTPLPLFPLVFYDLDGKGEAVGTCDASSVIGFGSKLSAKEIQGLGTRCYTHSSTGREVNLPSDFEDLSAPQKMASVTYVFTKKAHWYIQVRLDVPERFFIFKSSNVIACAADVPSGPKDNFDPASGGGGVTQACPEEMAARDAASKALSAANDALDSAAADLEAAQAEEVPPPSEEMEQMQAAVDAAQEAVDAAQVKFDDAEAVVDAASASGGCKKVKKVKAGDRL